MCGALFDLEISAGASPLEVAATLSNVSFADGGENLAAPAPPTDGATVTLAAP